MIEAIYEDGLLLQLLQFIVGSTLLLSTVLLLEYQGVIRNINLRAWLWKIVILASVILLLPLPKLLGPTFYLGQPTASVNPVAYSSEQIHLLDLPPASPSS